LLKGIDDAGTVQRFVFSSTCCTYGDVPADQMPITEATTTAGASGAYGKSKLAVEFMLKDYHAACVKNEKTFSLAILRYFNVAGADQGGVLGESREKQIRIIPILLEAALGKRTHVSIFGTSFPTPDGSSIRDYIHVDDLVDAHVSVLSKVPAGESVLYNLGIGRGYSVKELIAATKKVTGVDFEVREAAANPGEAACVYCDPSKVKAELGWEAKVKDVETMISTAWDFLQKFPTGFAGSSK